MAAGAPTWASRSAASLSTELLADISCACFLLFSFWVGE